MKNLYSGMLLLLCFFQISILFAQTTNPDAKYPIPNNYGDQITQGVNLFSGNVNLEFTLAYISSQSLSYQVKAFYNSRSAGLYNSSNTNYVNNELGGLGWKLSDYYKIAFDTRTNQYYLLDGQKQWNLLNSGSNQSLKTYSCTGKYHLWKFSISQNDFCKIIDDGGTQYSLSYTGVFNNVGYYNLRTIVDPFQTDTLYFVYGSNSYIQSIRNKYGDKLQFNYDNANHIENISFYQNVTGQKNQVISRKTILNYHSTPNVMLEGINYFIDPDIRDGLAEMVEENPGWKFTYNNSGYNLALNYVLSPTGSRTYYEYSGIYRRHILYYVVYKTKQDNMSNINTFSFYYPDRSENTSYDNVYLYSNNTVVFPGSYFNAADADTYFSSFEEKSPKDNPLISEDDGIESSTAHAHSGVRSLYFTAKLTWYLAYEDRKLVSKKLDLTNGSENPDSLTISYYHYGGYTISNGVRSAYLPNATFEFFDKNGDQIKGKWYNYIDCPYSEYGTKWSQYNYTVAVPSDAKTFRFIIYGGIDHGCFYLDDLSLKGGIVSPDGKTAYYFFNGNIKDSLQNLPSSYNSGIAGAFTIKDFFTGFESGGKEKWLNFSPKAKPDFVKSGFNNIESYEGDYALMLKSKSSDQGDQSVVSLADLQTVPPYANKIAVNFQYTNPSIQASMKLILKVSIDGKANLDTLSLTGNSNTGSNYFPYYKAFTAMPGQQVQCSLYVAPGPENNLLIDNLDFTFIDTLGSSQVQSNLQQQLFLGKIYNQRSFKKDDSEVESAFNYFSYPANIISQTPEYLLVNNITKVKRGSARTTSNIRFNNNGYPGEILNVKILQSPVDNDKKDTVWQKTNILYANDQYPGLADSNINILNPVVSHINMVSSNYGATWEITGADYIQWTKLSTNTGSNNNSLIPNASFRLKSPLTPSQLISDLNNFKTISNYKPSHTNWIYENTVTSRNQQTLEPSSSLNQDSILTNTIYSKGSTQPVNYNNYWWYHQNVLPVASFINDDVNPSLYFGFEDYETAYSSTEQDNRTSNYSHTGFKSQMASFGTPFSYNNSDNPDKKYIISVWVMAPSNNNFTIVIQDSTSRRVLLQTWTDTVSPGKWQNYEHVFTLPTKYKKINITINAMGTNYQNVCFDDIRIGPADAVFSAKVYDIDKGLLTASLDNNNNVTRYVYDQKNNNIAVISDSLVPKALSLTQFKRSFNYNPSISIPLNSKLDIAVQGGGKYYDFKSISQSNDWIISPSGNINSSINNQLGEILINANSLVELNPGIVKDIKNFGISFTAGLGEFLPNTASGIDNCVLSLTAGQCKFAALPRTQNSKNLIDYYLVLSSSYSFLNNKLTYQFTDTIYNLRNIIQQWTVIFQNNTLQWYVDGKLIFNTNFYNPVGTSISFNSMDGEQNKIYVKDIVVFNDPLLQINFADGEGKTDQSQIMINDSVITAQVMYNSMDKPYLTTLPVQLKGMFGYNSDFISSFDKKTGKMSGDVQQGINYIDAANSDDQYYLYSQLVYDESPLSEPVEQYRPGTYYSMLGQSYEHSKEGNIAKAVNWIYLHRDQISTALTYLGYAADIVNVVIEPEDPLAWTFVALDASDLLMAAFVVPQDASSNFKPPITSYFYDNRNRLSLIKLPMANNGSQPGQLISYNYDFLNRKIKEIAPESGTSRYLYDDAGRLRLNQTAGKGDTTIYYKYNRLGQLVEKGFFNYKWTDQSQDSLQKFVNDFNYPSANISNKLNSYIFGDTVQSSSGRNRISTATTFNVNNMDSVKEIYTYDNEGKILSREEQFCSDNSKYLTSYNYDNLGKITSVTYPQIKDNFIVTYSYNKMGYVGTIGNQSNPKAYAVYTYNPDGSIKNEIIYNQAAATIAGQYKYSAPGYITQINYPGYYSYNFNYNFAGWFTTNVRNDPQYGGFIKSAQYVPAYSGSGSTINLGYNYDPYGQLSNYKKNGRQQYAYDNLNLHFNDNHNLDSTSEYTSGTTVLQYLDKLTINSNNQPVKIANLTELLNTPFLPQKKDTLSYNYYENGSVKNSLEHYIMTQDGNFNTAPNILVIDSVLHTSKSFFYSPDNMPFSILVGDSVQISNLWNYKQSISGFDYNSYGERVMKTVKWYLNKSYTGMQTKKYIYGTNDMPLMEYIDSTSTNTLNNSSAVNYYIYAPTGLLVINTNNLKTNSSGSYFVLKDNQGSTIQVIDRNQTGSSPVSTYSYGAYGELDFSGNKNPNFFIYRYTGQEYDNETSLYNYKARMYDPVLKNFLSPDPIMQEPSQPYTYVANNPINYTDPTGMGIYDLIKVGEHAVGTAESIGEAAEKYKGLLPIAVRENNLEWFLTVNNNNQFVIYSSAKPYGEMISFEGTYHPNKNYYEIYALYTCFNWSPVEQRGLGKVITSYLADFPNVEYIMGKLVAEGAVPESMKMGYMKTKEARDIYKVPENILADMGPKDMIVPKDVLMQNITQDSFRGWKLINREHWPLNGNLIITENMIY